MASRSRYIGKSKKYRNVYEYINTEGRSTYTAKTPYGEKWGFLKERDCALCVDKILISNGKKPVNILVPLKKQTK